MRSSRIALAIATAFAFATPALAVDWNFYHHQSAPLFATSRGAKMLSEEIEKATNGELKARLHLSGTLQIAPNNITPAVASGVVQMADDLFNSGNIPVAGIPRLPGLVRSYEEFAKTAEVLRPYLVKAFADKGIVMIGEYTYPLQVIWGKKKLTSLEDIKGLKLRSLPTKIHVTFWRALGASPTPMDWAEVYPALQQGVVDGQENPPGIVFFEKLPEVQKYYSLTKHVNEPGNVLMSRASYEKVPPALQKALMSAARKATAFERAESQKDNDELLKKLEAAGMQVNAVPDATIAELRKVAHGLYGQALADLGPKGKELVDIGTALNR